MSIEYKIECTKCNHKWEILGDGCFQVNLNIRDMRCDKCGCQILLVDDLDSKPRMVDFTEQNASLAIKEENDFQIIMEAFVKLNSLAEDSSCYKNLKNWILKRIHIKIYASDDDISYDDIV